MSYEVRYTETARTDLLRFIDFLAEHDADAASRALDTIILATSLLERFPFTCRKAQHGNPFLRELVVSFGASGYIALFEIEATHVTILAIRHQREDDWFA